MDNDYTNESVEMTEVAEPSGVESEENLEVAEPETEVEESQSSGKTAQDSAFAEQRRRIAELEQQMRDKEEENKQLFDALGLYFNGDTSEELSINARAYADQRDPEEVRAEYEASRELEQLRADNEALQEQLLDREVERLMAEGLRDIQEIDPDVKSLEELGDSFANFITAGLSTKEAYYAVKAQEAREKTYAPSGIGKIADTKTERDYFTSEELDKLTSKELDDPKIWEKAMRSMNRL